MRITFRSRLSLLFLTFVLVLVTPAMALADVVNVSDANTLQASGDTTKQSGQTGTARFHLLANDNSTDPVNNCNANVSNKVKVTVEQSAKNAAGQTISSPVTFNSPGYVELEGCDDASTANAIEFAKTLGYTVGSSAQVGDVITVTGSASGGRTLGNGATGAFSFDSFKITVVAPPEQGTSLSVSAASGTYGGDTDLSAKLSSGSTNLSGKQVDFKLNGVSVGSATTGTDGVATKTVSLGSISAGGPYVDAVSAGYAGTGAQCSTGCYGPSDGKAVLTVDKADLTVTSDNKSKTYGDANPAFTGSVTGVKNGDDITASRSTTATAASGVGNHQIAATLSDPGNKLSNYNVTNNGGTLTIAKRPITVTADAQSKTYGQADPDLSYQVTSGSLVGADGFTGTLSRDAGENVGSYAIGQGSLSAGTNYNLAFVPGKLTITYNWAGFRNPVDNSGVFNVARAGSSIPMKFSLFGNQGLNIIEVGFPKATAISCTTNATTDVIEETTTTNSGLTYDATSDQYNYVWKTQSTYAGKCFKFDMVLKDGTSHTALFKFTK